MKNHVDTKTQTITYDQKTDTQPNGKRLTKEFRFKKDKKGRMMIT